ncbi:MAG: N-acetyl sugar amidotransferase [Flavobacteriales bacterium]|nr:N-acetyl sugar amidotransferase [Flavobacteriales bacterium]
MSERPYQICKRCVMDTSDPDIVFDDRGYCNHCEDYLSRIQAQTYIPGSSEKQLEFILERIKEKGKNKPYDCIVGISGGVDSCYTAHLCKQFGLRPLLIHMDNGWDTEISVKNVKTMVEKLGFDYVSYVLDWQEFREIQLAFLKSSIIDLEMPTDIAIPASIYEVAVKHNIKYILPGGNYTSEGILPLQMGYHVYKDMKLYRYIVKKYASVRLKKVPTFGLLKEIYYKFVKGIKKIYPLNYVPFDKDKARQFLIEQYGWEDYGGKHHESRITAFWQSYAMPVKYNMDYRRTTFASQICSGQITREKALEQLKLPAFDEAKISEDKKYIAKKFGITEEELEIYLNKPPKTYIDFPNNKKLISFVYKAYHFIFPNKRL